MTEYFRYNEDKKYCAKCNRLLEKNKFTTDRSKPEGLYSNCRECVNLKSRKYYHKNRDKYRAKYLEKKAALNITEISADVSEKKKSVAPV